MNKKIPHLFTCVVFFALIGIITLFSILLPDRSFSETERRTLAKLPSLTISSLTTQNQGEKFSQKYEEYVADQFLLRDAFVTVKNHAEVLLGKKDLGGVWLGEDAYLFSKETEIDRQKLSRNLGLVAAFLTQAEECESVERIAVTLVPDSAHVLNEKLPKFAPLYDFGTVDTLARNALSDRYVDVFTTLSKQNTEYIYYRTDHHWTTLGAYYAYAQLADSLGYTANAKDAYSTQVVSDSFTGTLAAKINLPVAEDAITKFTLPGTNECTMETDTESKNSIYDESALSGQDRYNYFLGGNAPINRIQTEIKNNKHLLVIKDSYAHSLIPFLCNHYESIVCVDLRHYTDNVKDLIKREQITDILVLYQATNFAKDDSILLLNR